MKNKPLVELLIRWQGEIVEDASWEPYRVLCSNFFHLVWARFSDGEGSCYMMPTRRRISEEQLKRNLSILSEGGWTYCGYGLRVTGYVDERLREERDRGPGPWTIRQQAYITSLVYI